METESSLPHSQTLVICPHTEPQNPVLSSLFKLLKIDYNIIFPSLPTYLKWSHFVRCPHQIPGCISPARITHHMPRPYSKTLQKFMVVMPVAKPHVLRIKTLSSKIVTFSNILHFLLTVHHSISVQWLIVHHSISVQWLTVHHSISVQWNQRDALFIQFIKN
jgi:hypothetical protein